MLALADNFDLDLTSLATDASDRLVMDLREALADPVFGEAVPNLQELKSVASNAPDMARAVLALYEAYRKTNEKLAGMDAALARVASAEQATTDAQTGLNRATLHRKAAEDGLLFLDDGSDGLAVQRGFEDARLSRDRARADLAAARRDADAARQVLDETQQLLDRQRAAAILGSPGGMVLSLTATRDAAVRAGEPIAALRSPRMTTGSPRSAAMRVRASAWIARWAAPA